MHSLTTRKGMLFGGVVLLGGLVAGWLVLQSAQADDDPKDTPKKPDAETAERLREAAARANCADNLRQIAPAFHHHQDGGALPTPQPQPHQPLFVCPSEPPSWAHHLLPYIEQDNLYRYSVSNPLGATREPVGRTLASHLNLPADRGQVITSIDEDGAAAKAGLQTDDILLEIDGKPVPADGNEFAKLLESIKADTAVKATVIRKGQKVELKELKLAAVKPDGRLRIYQCPTINQIQDGTSNTILIGEQSRPDWTKWAEDWGRPALREAVRKEKGKIEIQK